MDENKTTEKIKETLGVSYTVAEVKAFLAEFEAKSQAQAPYFDGRLMDKIELLKSALS